MNSALEALYFAQEDRTNVAAIGMAPRFATAHLCHRNMAVAGIRKSFTDLADEFLFIDENARSVPAFQRVAEMQFAAAAAALRSVITVNTCLFNCLNVDRLFYCARPYYKPYRVGRLEYRGADADDFSGINEVYLLLGLCQANDPSYAQLLADKMLFMVPEDQARLRDCMRHRNFLDEFLSVAENHVASG